MIYPRGAQTCALPPTEAINKILEKYRISCQSQMSKSDVAKMQSLHIYSYQVTSISDE